MKGYLVRVVTYGKNGEPIVYRKKFKTRAEAIVDKEAYVEAVAGSREIITQQITTIVTCCGEDLECDAFTVTCEYCGADYNFSGSRLAHRSQWGEETGEPWHECY